jgi:predicted ATPase
MISKLVLSGFKSFSQYQTLKLGNFSILLGTNASGKSNVGDALRFLQGTVQGYTFLEVLNGKRGIHGETVWKGIRGGINELFHGKTNECSLSVAKNNLKSEYVYNYGIMISKDASSIDPFLFSEDLIINDNKVCEFRFTPDSSKGVCNFFDIMRHGIIDTKFLHSGIFGDVFKFPYQDKSNYPTLRLQTHDPNMFQSYRRLPESDKQKLDKLPKIIDEIRHDFVPIKFFDLNPEVMRTPSLTGQTVLGEQGENLSSVLQAISKQADTKANLLEWLGALTPTDATNFKFYTDPYTNKVLAILVESNGQETSLYSASDGTLRFLAILAALFSPTPASLYFFEEIENGIHPSRLYLLVELLEKRAESGIQIIATTHSPQLLSLVSQSTLENSSLIYRAGDHHSSQIMPILDIPNIKEILEKQDIAKLYATGWFEDVMEFMQGDAQ